MLCLESFRSFFPFSISFNTKICQWLKVFASNGNRFSTEWKQCAILHKHVLEFGELEIKRQKFLFSCFYRSFSAVAQKNTFLCCGDLVHIQTIRCHKNEIYRYFHSTDISFEKKEEKILSRHDWSGKIWQDKWDTFLNGLFKFPNAFITFAFSNWFCLHCCYRDLLYKFISLIIVVIVVVVVDATEFPAAPNVLVHDPCDYKMSIDFLCENMKF